MAYWLARALNLQPVRGQQDILNNYLDWRSADPEKVPFIEAVLQNKIMNGDGSGRFNPTGPITRETSRPDSQKCGRPGIGRAGI